MPRSYWVMRTDRTKIPYIYSELREGRLRQGWGNLEDLDLRDIKELASDRQSLSEEQRQAWRRNRRLLAEEPDGIAEGDIVLLPHLPEVGLWSVAKVQSNQYRYEISSELNDYGHIREVELLNPETPVNPYSKHVSASLRNTMRTQLPLWNIDQHEQSMDALLEAISSSSPEVTSEHGSEQRLARIRSKLTEQLWGHLHSEFQSAEFEKPCFRLLQALYESVDHTAGVKERGADFICGYSDGLGIPHRVVVQVKMWEGEGKLDRPIEQIRQACLNYDAITSAAIFTTLDAVDESSEHHIKQLSKELGIPVKLLLKDEVLELFLQHLPEMTSALDQGSVTASS